MDAGSRTSAVYPLEVIPSFVSSSARVSRRPDEGDSEAFSSETSRPAAPSPAAAPTVEIVVIVRPETEHSEKIPATFAVIRRSRHTRGLRVVIRYQAPRLYRLELLPDDV